MDNFVVARRRFHIHNDTDVWTPSQIPRNQLAHIVISRILGNGQLFSLPFEKTPPGTGLADGRDVGVDVQKHPSRVVGVPPKV